MAEIAAIVAVLVALGALWLASHANKHVDSSFEEYGRHLAKQVREAQAAFERKTSEFDLEVTKLSREVDALQAQIGDNSEKLNTLTQRIKVVEHDLKSMTDALPPQLLQRRAGKR
ncbi:MAG: hypothetical protein JJ900_08885 [Rhodospirillales bacterium]|nr:hypothetical protein [Rhodospirillales bacterium]MBO6786954.1 hypothetical protein [Rhodospirillales bacterium]